MFYENNVVVMKTCCIFSLVSLFCRVLTTAKKMEIDEVKAAIGEE